MEHIIEKLGAMNSGKNVWKEWSLKEIKTLLEIYHVISKKESHIFDFIYANQGSDTWEDIFRDYDDQYFEDKASGVQEVIDHVTEVMKAEDINQDK
jgi:hypothetical protein